MLQASIIPPTNAGSNASDDDAQYSNDDATYESPFFPPSFEDSEEQDAEWSHMSLPAKQFIASRFALWMRYLTNEIVITLPFCEESP